MANDSERFWRENIRPGTTFGQYSRAPTLWQRFYDRMAARKARITCWLMGHEYITHQEFSSYSRRVICKCCDGDWAMNDNVRIMVPWDSEFASFYESQGHEIKHR